MAEKVVPMANSIGVHKGVRVLNIPVIMVEFTDKDGSKQTKLAIIAGKEVRFFADNVISSPAQEWLAGNILKAAGVED